MIFIFKSNVTIFIPLHLSICIVRNNSTKTYLKFRGHIALEQLETDLCCWSKYWNSSTKSNSKMNEIQFNINEIRFKDTWNPIQRLMKSSVHFCLLILASEQHLNCLSWRRGTIRRVGGKRSNMTLCQMRLKFQDRPLLLT